MNVNTWFDTVTNSHTILLTDKLTTRGDDVTDLEEIDGVRLEVAHFPRARQVGVEIDGHTVHKECVARDLTIRTVRRGPRHSQRGLVQHNQVWRGEPGGRWNTHAHTHTRILMLKTHSLLFSP